MILVVGFAVLIGVAAAFYFTVRSRSTPISRLPFYGRGMRGPGAAGLSRGAAGIRGVRAAREALGGGLREAAGDEPGNAPGDAPRAASGGTPGGAPGGARTRRRVGWRKGADVDQELWPAEAFGGITDEQFWDDLASDKPLETTARTAQQSQGPASRPPEAVPAPGRHSGGGPAQGHGRRPGVPGPHPQGLTQPVPTARPAAAVAVPRPAAAARPVTAAQPTPAPKARPPAASHPAPGETEARGRGRRSAGEDPLTSAAFALRASGPVDGRSFRKSPGSPDPDREQYPADAARRPGTGPAGAFGGTPPYQYPEQPYRDSPGPYGADGPLGATMIFGAGGPFDGPGVGGAFGEDGRPGAADTASAKTPPYGERYELGGGPGGPAEDPRRPGGRTGHGQDDTWPPHVNGGYRSGGDRQNGYPGSNPWDGYHGPRDPRGNDRRLPAPLARGRHAVRGKDPGISALTCSARTGTARRRYGGCVPGLTGPSARPYSTSATWRG